MKPNAKDYSISLINRTGTPISPLIIQKLADGIEASAHMLVPIAKKEDVDAISARLFKDFEDLELNTIAGSPEFFIALLSAVKVTMMQFTNESLEWRHKAYESKF